MARPVVRPRGAVAAAGWRSRCGFDVALDDPAAGSRPAHTARCRARRAEARRRASGDERNSSAVCVGRLSTGRWLRRSGRGLACGRRTLRWRWHSSPATERRWPHGRSGRFQSWLLPARLVSPRPLSLVLQLGRGRRPRRALRAPAPPTSASMFSSAAAITPTNVTHRTRITLGDKSLAQDAVATRDELHDRFVGFDFRERIATLYGVALVLQPFDETALLHRGRERLHEYFRRHCRESQSRYMTLRTAAIVFATSGFAARSRFFAYGIGTSA